MQPNARERRTAGSGLLPLRLESTPGTLIVANGLG
jgi:hypothetical protein